jgi:TetR/AcrR family transcriptional regulator
MQQEMMRVHKGENTALPTLVERVFAPVMTMYQSMVREGVASGELIEVEWMQIYLASLGANVFYFLSAPVWRMLLPTEPFSSEAIAARRIALVEFLGQAIFKDRQRGAEVVRRVMADTPLPAFDADRLILGRKNERAQ